MNAKKTLLLGIASMFIWGNVVFAFNEDELLKDDPQKVAWFWGKSKAERKDEKDLLAKKKQAEKKAQRKKNQKSGTAKKKKHMKKEKKEEKAKKRKKSKTRKGEKEESGKKVAKSSKRPRRKEKTLMLAAREDKAAMAREKKARDAAKKQEKLEKEKSAKICKAEEKAKKKERAAAKRARKVASREVKAERMAERRLARIVEGKIRYADREPSDGQIEWAVNKWEKDLARFKEDKVSARDMLTANWRMVRKREVAQEYKDGMYADLYKVPSWPIEASFFDHKSQVNVTSKFNYQTSAYSSVGSGHDLSKLYFGEDPIRLRDILLAYKLQREGVVGNVSLVGSGGTNYIDTNYIKTSQDFIPFLAESEEFVKSINYSRYIWSRNVLIGLQVPIAYKKHILKFSVSDDTISGQLSVNWASKSYFFNRVEQVLALKNLHYNRKNSITGIGDISLFANVEINSRYFEKANWGLRLQLPTSKDADPNKLWAPSLGEEFTKFSGHVAMLWSPRPWINPHVFMQGTYGASANVHRRVPRKITHTDSEADELLTDVMLLGNRVRENDRSTFTEWDTTVPGMADASYKVDIQPGPEVFIRLGNMLEKFLLRRSFLDIYYDFRAKFEDSASGLPEDNYNLRILEQNTHQIEHNIGFNFSYQFDYHTRLQGGGRYTFYGINVPQTFELSCNLGVEF